MNNDNPSSDLEYWSKILKNNPTDETINAFSFEDKYKIIEYVYNQCGLKCDFTFEQIANQLNNSYVSDELFNNENTINRLAYWVLGLWGSLLNLPQSPEVKFNYIPISKDIWYFDGEQDEINYFSYVNRLHEMRETKFSISNWEESFDISTNAFHISFVYDGVQRFWKIMNESPGWLNGIFFKLYSSLTSMEYQEMGNYFIIGEGQGGYVMFLTYEAEEYIRTLWDFPKKNKQGRLKTIYKYGQLFEPKS